MAEQDFTVSAETARRIWEAHKEIEQAGKMLAEMRDTGHRGDVTPRDAFGRHHSRYEFGVPSGSNGHRLYGVSPRLAQVVVEAHIAEMRRQLAEMSAVARLELETPARSTDVRVKRLQDISEADAIAEGMRPFDFAAAADRRWGTEEPASFVSAYQYLWTSLHGPESWASNPWICAVSFETEHANIDAARAGDRS